MDGDPYLEYLSQHRTACSETKRTCSHFAHRRRHLRLRYKAQKKWQKICKRNALESGKMSRAKRIVCRYVRSRDRKRCGGCGNKLPRKKAYLAAVVPSGVGHFGLTASKIVTISRHEWTALGQFVDNAQAACKRSCRSSGKDAKEWRNSVMERLPVAQSPDEQDYLFLPF
ncbi:hypothetical protein [Candidatus Poriferisodalis sp.]|uniref:hypothetical protein n=1 Tax=Candidatus Poriferisodalis sp. TaxID=3101277 RepID=UPI003B5AF065